MLRAKSFVNYKSMGVIILILLLGYFINWVIRYQNNSSYIKLKEESPIWSVRGSSKYTLYLAPTKEVRYKVNTFGSAIVSRPLVYDSSGASHFVETTSFQKDRQVSVFEKQYGATISMGFVKNKHALLINNHNTLENIDHLDIHDVILNQDGSLTVMRYLPDLNNKLLHLGIDTINPAGQIIWSWTSEGRISPNWDVSSNISKKLSLRYFGEIIRDFFSTILYKKFRSLAIKMHSWELFGYALITEEQGLRSLRDYVHGNSIQFIDNNQKILVSARNLDTIFAIDVKTKRITWTLGGNFSLMTQNRPTGDPRNGFSHQHTARIINNRLYVFDNANLYSLPSRAVIYEVDESNLGSAKFLYEYLEPYGYTRTTMGSIQPLDKDNILIGWGGIGSPNLIQRVTPAVSIVNIKNNRSIFQMDFKPSYSSYKVSSEVKRDF